MLHAEQHDFKDLQMFLQVFSYDTMHASSNNSEFVALLIGDLPLIQTHWRSFLGDIRVPAKLSAYCAPSGVGATVLRGSKESYVRFAAANYLTSFKNQSFASS